MNFYERYLLPTLLDLLCGLPAISRQRALVVPQARGRVLEVGFGSGRNLPHYGADVREVLALDPHPGFARVVRRRSRQLNFALQSLSLAGEAIDLEDNCVDDVVLTYTLCSVAEPTAVLDEIRRVLRPGGRLLLAEHGAAPQAGVRRWQERLTPGWRHLAGNCHMNRDPVQMLAEAGWRTDGLSQGYIPGPKMLCYNYWGLSQPQ